LQTVSVIFSEKVADTGCGWCRWWRSRRT